MCSKLILIEKTLMGYQISFPGDDLFEFASMESRYTQQLSSIEKVPLDVNLKDTAEEEVSFTEVEKLSPYYSFSSENQEVNDTYHISKTSPSKEAGIDTRTPENSSRFFSKVKHVHVNEQEFSFRPRCSTDSQVSLMKKRIKCRRNVSNNGKKEEKPIKTISSFMSKSPIALSDSDSNGKSVSPDSKHCKIEECSLISSHLNLDKNQNNLQRKPSPENETGFRPRLYSENCALLIKKRQNLIKKGIFKKEKENGKSYTMLQGTMKKTQAFVVSDLTSKSRQDMNVKILINADKNLPRADSESSISKKCKQRLTGCNVSHDFEISISQFRPRHNSESKVSKIKEDNDKPKSSLVKEMQFLELPKYEHNFNSAFENSGRCSSSPILPPINNSNGGSDSQLSIISFLPTSSKGSATSTESLTKPRFRQRLHSEGNDTKVDQSSDLPLLDTKEPVRPRRNPDEIPLASRDFVQFSEAREELPFRPRLHSDSNHMKTNKSSHLTVDPKEPFRPRRNTDDMLSEKRKMKIKASKSNDDLVCFNFFYHIVQNIQTVMKF